MPNDEIPLSNAELGTTDVTIIIATTDVDMPAFDFTDLLADEPVDEPPILVTDPPIIDVAPAFDIEQWAYMIEGGSAFPAHDLEYYTELWGFSPESIGFHLVPLTDVFL